MVPVERLIDARDALERRLATACAELDQLHESSGGGPRKQRRIIGLIKRCDLLTAGIERLQDSIERAVAP